MKQIVCTCLLYRNSENKHAGLPLVFIPRELGFIRYSKFCYLNFMTCVSFNLFSENVYV